MLMSRPIIFEGVIDMKRIAFAPILLTFLVLGCIGCGKTKPQPGAEKPKRLEFTRLIAHWEHYVDPGYLKFVEDAQPEIVQVGFYGGDFWSLGHLPDSAKGLTGPLLPTHAGVVKATGEAERLKANADYFERLNRELHRRGVKVIGHFSVVKYLLGKQGQPEGPREGFFRFYRDLWDEKELGPKPVQDPVELLQKNADGTPIMTPDEDAAPYGVYYGCLNNPHWRAVLKAFVKRGIERGVDGYVINYFYRLNCLCEHCRRNFKAYLRERFTPAELRKQFGIENLETHEFSEIVSRHDPRTATPLRLEMHRFSDISNKKAFDEVFIQYGRSLKPDLILAQWLHISSDFGYPPTGSVDERAMLPAEMWGKGEDYIWYSIGAADPALVLRYIRGSFEDKPYTAGRYERVKLRTAMAELAANGGAPMGRYVNFTEPLARQEFVRYYQFLKRYDEVYRANQPHSEAVLLHPRSLVHRGQFFESMTAYQEVGRRLLDEHVLFDVIPDDIVTDEQLAKYKRVFTISSRYQMQAEKFAGFSRFEAPKTVRVSASRPAAGDEITMHFVNYNREEPKQAARTVGIADERPIAVEGVRADVIIPKGFRAVKVEMVTPEDPDPKELAIERAEGRVQFTLPKFLVYAVARIRLERS
jgi:hypothetical protein